MVAQQSRKPSKNDLLFWQREVYARVQRAAPAAPKREGEARSARHSGKSRGALPAGGATQPQKTREREGNSRARAPNRAPHVQGWQPWNYMALSFCASCWCRSRASSSGGERQSGQCLAPWHQTHILTLSPRLHLC